MPTFSSLGEADMQAGRLFNGIESLDHPVIAARDLDVARVTYERLGFTVPPRGSHVEWGTGNLCIMFPDDYIEIRGIVDASRFTMNLGQHLDRFGEGLMGVAFRSDDIRASYEAMTTHGLRVSEPRRLTRNFEHPEGWTKPSFRLCVPESEDIEGLMHVVVLQHLTPELIRRPEFLVHANGCKGVNDISGVIYDAEQAASKLSHLLGAEAVHRSADGVRLELPTGQRINLLFVHAYRAKFGDISKLQKSKTSCLGAMTLRVESTARVQEILTGNGLTFDIMENRGIRIGPESACGVILDFTEDPPG